jgi:hypothetical protein
MTINIIRDDIIRRGERKKKKNNYLQNFEGRDDVFALGKLMEKTFFKRLTDS